MKPKNFKLKFFPNGKTNGLSSAGRKLTNGFLSLIIAGTMCAPLSAQNDRTVYVCGNDGQGRPVYWKDGIEVPLVDQVPNGPWGNNVANSIFVDGDDIYTAGNEIYTTDLTGQYQARYWKNGVMTTLSLGAIFEGVIGGTSSFYYASISSDDLSRANSIFVSNGNVYVAGKQGYILHYQDTYYPYEWHYAFCGDCATLWTNGVPQILAISNTLPQTYSTECKSVFVSGNDVYVAGYGNQGAGVYWKNGVETALSTDGVSGAIVRNIFVSGNDVYVCGYYGTTYGYWKNGVMNALPGAGGVTSIYVYGNDVYVTGSVKQNDIPAGGYWKNGQWTSLSITSGYDFYTAYTNSVFVIDNDVYIAGSVSGGLGGLATYWKNGERITLSNNPNSTAKSIFVTPGSNTGINNVTQENINIYPNPVKEVLYIMNNEQLTINNLVIIDLSGKIIMSLPSQSSQINVAHLASGIYFLKIQTDKGIVTKKFIKE